MRSRDLGPTFSDRSVSSSSPPTAAVASAASPTPSSSSHKVAIVGAGLAGLSAGARLAQLGLSCTIFDAGYDRPGGRATSSRRRGEAPEGQLQFEVDHGAQCLTATNETFWQELRRLSMEGVVSPWKGNFVTIDPKTMNAVDVKDSGDASAADPGFCGIVESLRRSQQDEGSLFVGVPNMGSIAAHLAREIELSGLGTVRLGHTVMGASVSSNGANGVLWNLHGRQAAHGTTESSETRSTVSSFHESFSAVVVADSQACMLFRNPSTVADDCEAFTLVNSALKDVACDAFGHIVGGKPLFSLTVAFKDPLGQNANFSGASIPQNRGSEGNANACHGDNSPRGSFKSFQWISRDSSKPGWRGLNTPECWVAIASEEKSAQLLEKWPLKDPITGRVNRQTPEYRKMVADDLLKDFLELMPEIMKRKANGGAQPHLPEILYCTAQRWGRGLVSLRDSLPIIGDERFLRISEARWAVCGDFCGDLGYVDGIGPAEFAWLSGRDAAGAVASWLNPSSSSAPR